MPLVLLRCLKLPFRSAVVPRLCLIIFRYSQPLLIRHTIRFVSQPPNKNNDERQGFWILISGCFVYIGLAVCAYLATPRVVPVNTNE